ncbi:MAG: hypothetical protein WA040_24370 [Anaerolineae bacterium]
MELAQRIGFLPEAEFTELSGSLNMIGRQLTSLHNKLRVTTTKAPGASQE